VSMLSLTRCYKCVFERTVRVKAAIIITVVLFLFNAFHSVLPILPVGIIQDMFRVSMTFSSNPFMTEYSKKELVRKFKVYNGEDISIPGTYSMLEDLKKISSKQGIFEGTELGYYSYSPLCIHNIYGFQTSLAWYKMLYITKVVLLLTVVSISYIFIMWHAYRVSKKAQRSASNTVNNNNKELSIKVVLVIGSQLLCWIIVVFLMVGYSLSSDAPDLYELTATVLLPMNSYLNPIFNTSLYKRILEWSRKKYEVYVSRDGKNLELSSAVSRSSSSDNAKI